MALEPETVVLIKEAFAGHVCSVCGFQAQRLFAKRGSSEQRYFCADHVPVSTKTPLLKPVEMVVRKDPCIGRRLSFGF